MRTPRLAPWLVMASLAVGGALVHITPFMLAQRNTPPGYRFTGVLTQSPDMMQYRVWMRDAVDTGPIIRNSLTSEPNRAFLPVPFFWLVAKAAAATGTTGELWYRIFGAILAAALVVVVYRIVSQVFPDPHQRNWTFLAFLLGGTITAVIRLAVVDTRLEHLKMVQYVFFAGASQVDGLERARSIFPVQVIFDTHYLVLWLLLIGCIFTTYRTLEQATPGRTALAMLLVMLTVFVHIHQFVLLSLIFAGIAIALLSRGLLERRHIISLLLIAGAGLVVAGWVGSLEHRSGFPLPEWRTNAEPVSVVLLGFPVAFGLMVWGLRRYWLAAGLRECVFLGWILGCLLLTASGPYYPFPLRGLLTIQLPMVLVAAGIYFAHRSRLSRAAMAVILILGVSMILATVPTRLRNSRFRPSRTLSWLTPAHDAVIATLKQVAGPSDVLLVNAPDRLWLAPAYPGVMYVAHGFLTTRFPDKQFRLDRFLEDSNSVRQGQFLEGAQVRFLYIDSSARPERFHLIPGLRPILEERCGTLFEYTLGTTSPPAKLPYQPIGYLLVTRPLINGG